MSAGCRYGGGTVADTDVARLSETQQNARTGSETCLGRRRSYRQHMILTKLGFDLSIAFDGNTGHVAFTVTGETLEGNKNSSYIKCIDQYMVRQ